MDVFHTQPKQIFICQFADCPTSCSRYESENLQECSKSFALYSKQSDAFNLHIALCLPGKLSVIIFFIIIIGKTALSEP